MIPSKKRVVIFEGDQLIGTGVRLLLTRRSDFEVTTVFAGATDLEETLRNLEPEIIILEAISLLANSEWYVQALQLPQPLRVIVLNAAHNQVQIWDKSVRLVGHLDDFLALI